MTACFVSWLVEMPKDAKPDWGAAKAYIGKLSANDLDFEQFTQLLDYENFHIVVDGEKPPEKDYGGYTIEELRDEALQHLAVLEEHWDEHTVVCPAPTSSSFRG